MAELTRMIYVDDSGSVDHGGLIVYGWVEVSPANWRTALRQWLDLRKQLWTDFAVPASAELHTTEYANGRTRISKNPPPQYVNNTGQVLHKDMGRDIARRCLEALRDIPEISVGTVYRWSGKQGSDYAQDRYDVYRELVERLDQQLVDGDAFGFITMDGDDPHYRNAHRSLKLATRRVLEDPAYHDSKHSQWTQMADLVAYSANVTLNRHPGNQFGWDWYQDYLSASDPNRAPQPCCNNHAENS